MFFNSNNFTILKGGLYSTKKIETSTGTTMVTGSLRVSGGKVKGVKKDEMWFDIVAFGFVAEIILKLPEKSYVQVMGTNDMQTYTPQNSSKKVKKHQIIVNDIHVVSHIGNDFEQGPPPSKATPQQSEYDDSPPDMDGGYEGPDDDQDIPF
jgi:single-stranded DNA-binding protein